MERIYPLGGYRWTLSRIGGCPIWHRCPGCYEQSSTLVCLSCVSSTFRRHYRRRRLWTEPSVSFTPRSWRCGCWVFCLKYGGDAVGELVGFLSKKNGDLVKKHSYELGSELDRLSTNIENSMRDFMHEDLGFSLSASRSIAWAIMQVKG